MLPNIISAEPVIDTKANTNILKVELICSKDDLELDIACHIRDTMETEMGLSARVNDDKEDTASLLSKLDKADLIVALLSPKFLLDPDLIEALQVAINRQRYDKHTRLYPVLLSSTLPPSTPTSEDYKRYCELLMYELSYEDPIWSSLTLDEEMQRHDNYKTMMNGVSVIQAQYEAMREKRRDDSSEDDDKLLRSQKDKQVKRLKFVHSVCNRALYHILNPQATDSRVLIDIYSYIKLVVNAKADVEKKRATLMDGIRKNYAGIQVSNSSQKESNLNDEKIEVSDGKLSTDKSSHTDKAEAAADDDGDTEPPSEANKPARDNIHEMRSKYRNENQTNSQSCVLL